MKRWIAAAVATATVAVTAGVLLVEEPPQGCDLVASEGQSLPAFVDRLSDGDTGCLEAGTYPVSNYTLAKSGITLTAVEGQVAKIKGRLWIRGDRVTLEGLVLDNENAADLPSSITGDDVVLRENEIVNHHTTICFNIGSLGWGRAVGTLIERNRIHDCGRLPATNYDHGLYLEASDNVVIRDNWIYDNADRGIQLYPDADNTLIEHNVIDRNGEGIVFGGYPDRASSDTIIRNNLITNSKLRDNVESAYGPGEPVGRNNLVAGNCIYGGAYDEGDGGILQNAEGFTATDNLLVNPRYKDATAGDYRLRKGSPCLEVMAGATPPVAKKGRRP